MDGQQLKDVNSQDEINLIDLLRTLWQQKLVILLSTSLCLLIGVSYILFSKPIYEATGYISPPSNKDIGEINYGRSKSRYALLDLYTIKDVYSIFTQALLSEATKRDFYNKVYLPSMAANYPQNKLPRLFAKNLIIREIAGRSLPTPDSKPSNYTVSMKGASPELDAKLVQEYIDLAQQKALKELIAEDRFERRQAVRDLQEKIDSIRDIANNNRLDRIQQLKEANKVAQTLGIKVAALNGVMIDAKALNNVSLMYLRGQNALQAELNNLNARDSMDAFAPSKLKLREKQSQLDLFTKIVVNPAKVMMFKSDSVIEIPQFPIAPRKRLILVLSLFAGLFLGSMLVIMRKLVSVLF